MTYLAKPKFHHPDLPKNSLGYTHRDYEGSVSTLCAGCGHDHHQSRAHTLTSPACRRSSAATQRDLPTPWGKLAANPAPHFRDIMNEPHPAAHLQQPITPAPAGQVP